jgi:hypothetical protein
MKRKKIVRVLIITLGVLAMIYLIIFLYMVWGAGTLGDDLGI